MVYATSLTDSAPSPELGEKPCAIQRPGASPANETLIAALLCFVRDRREYQPEGPNVKPTHDSGVGSRIRPWGFSPPCHFICFSVGEGGRAIFSKEFACVSTAGCELVLRPAGRSALSRSSSHWSSIIRAPSRALLSEMPNLAIMLGEVV